MTQARARRTRSKAMRFIAHHWRPYLVLSAFCLLLLRSFGGDRTIYWGDLALYFEPMYRLVRSRLVVGHIPLWNPYILCGQPLLGNPQMGVFYPGTLLISLCSAWDFIRVSCGIHLWLCGAFTYHYLRRWTAHYEAALAGALVFMGSAALLGRLQFPPMIFAIAYLPLLLRCIDSLLDSGSRWARIGLAITVGLLLLAAHPHVAYLSVLSGTVYAGARITRIAWHVPLPELRFRRKLQLALALVGPALGGAAIAAVQLLPAVQVMLESPRERMTPGQANRFVLDPAHLLTLIWPHFLGHPATRDYWGPGNVWEPALFFGWLPLALIAYAWLYRKGAPYIRFWFLVIGVCLWLAMGVDAGLYAVAFYALPGLGKFHDPARFLLPATFGCAALTGIGMDAVQRKLTLSAEGGRERLGGGVAAVILSAIALPMMWYAPEWLPAAKTAVLTESRPAFPADGVLSRGDGSGGRLYLPAHELISRNYISAGYTDYGDSGQRGIAAMVATLMPNLNISQQIESASGYEPVPLRGAAALDSLTRAAYRRAEPDLGHLLRIMDVGTVVVPGAVRFRQPEFTNLYPANSHYRTLRYLQVSKHGLVWLTRRVRHVEGEGRIAAFLSAPSFDPWRISLITEPILAGEPDLERVGGTADAALAVNDLNAAIGDGASERLKWHRDESGERVVIDVNAGRAAAYVVTSIAAFPGWRASVDGRRAAIHHTDGAIMGVYVGPGTHHIELSYAPECYRVGLYVTLMALMGVMCRAVGAYRQETRRARRLSEP